MEDSGIYSSLVLSSLTSRSSICEIVIGGGDILLSAVSQVVMSVSYLWFSELGFLESLRLSTSGLLVCFPGSGSVLDTDTWGEVFLMGDVCDSTSILCLDSGMWVFLWVSLLKGTWVSRGCCQTTSGNGGSFNWVVSGLSIAAPEWRRGIVGLNFGLQPGELL